MPASSHNRVLCSYQYDALDRLDSSVQLSQDSLQRFYSNNRLSTEIQGSLRYSFVRYGHQLLAQQRHDKGEDVTSLLMTDQKSSVLNALSVAGTQPARYAPYGHTSPENGLLSLIGFNGERRDPLTSHYPLGNGYRQFNPLLMRFNSVDSWSPFGLGGLNAYAYCAGNPIDRSDPSGHFAWPVARAWLYGASGVIGLASSAATVFVKDDTAKTVLGAVAIIGVVVGGVGFKADRGLRQWRNSQRMQRRTSNGSDREGALNVLPRESSIVELAPRYPHQNVATWPSAPLNFRLPPPYSKNGSNLPKVSVPPPAYSTTEPHPGFLPSPSLPQTVSRTLRSPETGLRRASSSSALSNSSTVLSIRGR